jgi:predicted nucleic acid-binding Zn ribbon protein
MNMDFDVIHPRKYKKKCGVCGKDFDGWNKNQKYCSEECKHVSHLQRGEMYRENARLKAEQKKEEAKKKKALEEIAMAARNAGMTYGQYVARMGL